MADRDYGWQREDDVGRPWESRRAEPQERGGERGPYPGREDWESGTREEQAFGGYPDYREDRYARSEQGAYRPRGMPRPYARERAEPYYGVSQGYGGAGHGERYREEMRGAPAAEYERGPRAPYHSSPEAYPPTETPYPQQERGDDWAPRGEPYAPTRYGRFAGATLESQYARGYAEPASYPDTYRAEPYGGRPYGRGEQRYAAGSTGAAGEEEFEPDYRDWRRRQMEALDDDYRAFREERRNKFRDEFENYRKNRTRTSGATSAKQAGSPTDKSGG